VGVRPGEIGAERWLRRHMLTAAVAIGGPYGTVATPARLIWSRICRSPLGEPALQPPFDVEHVMQLLYYTTPSY